MVDNLYTSHISHLVCSDCQKEYPANEVQTFCPECHSLLLVNYDLESIKKSRKRENFSSRNNGMWRWTELLPVLSASHRITLGEGDTPLLPLQNLGEQLGLSGLFLKDEGKNPTASFEARGMATAISKAKELGIRKIALSDMDNATSALAAYAARAGLQAHMFMHPDTPKKVLDEIRIAGASVELVDGLVVERNSIPENMLQEGWFDFSAFHEPYNLEGKKTIGYEIAETFDWELPDVIICPTGHGSSLVGVWKALNELKALGWLGNNGKLPRFVAVQARGCAPIVKAFDAGASYSDYWTNARAIAPHVVVPKSFADQLILKILYETEGTAISVSDEAMRAAQKQFRTEEGIYPSYEGAGTLAALFKLVQQKWVKPDEKIVLLNHSWGLKSLEAQQQDDSVG